MPWLNWEMKFQNLWFWTLMLPRQQEHGILKKHFLIAFLTAVCKSRISCPLRRASRSKALFLLLPHLAYSQLVELETNFAIQLRTRRPTSRLQLPIAVAQPVETAPVIKPMRTLRLS